MRKRKDEIEFCYRSKKYRTKYLDNLRLLFSTAEEAKDVATQSSQKLQTENTGTDRKAGTD